MQHDASDYDSEEENEDGDLTVYECPGLAPVRSLTLTLTQVLKMILLEQIIPSQNPVIICFLKVFSVPFFLSFILKKGLFELLVLESTSNKKDWRAKRMGRGKKDSTSFNKINEIPLFPIQLSSGDREPSPHTCSATGLI